MEAVQTHRWTREEYERMGEVGILHPEARTELIDGEVIEMSPQNSLHSTAIVLVGGVLISVMGSDHTVRVQLPLALTEIDLPEPDVAAVRGVPRDYRDAHPRDAVLVVEVSESSLNFDRGPKLGLYALSGIPEYWIVNLVDYSLEVYLNPAGEKYVDRTVYHPGDKLSPLVRPGAVISVTDLLP